jgi:hypothetical protein
MEIINVLFGLLFTMLIVLIITFATQRKFSGFSIKINNQEPDTNSEKTQNNHKKSLQKEELSSESGGSEGSAFGTKTKHSTQSPQYSVSSRGGTDVNDLTKPLLLIYSITSKITERVSEDMQLNLDDVNEDFNVKCIPNKVEEVEDSSEGEVKILPPSGIPQLQHDEVISMDSTLRNPEESSEPIHKEKHVTFAVDV